jgi:hypothetical protein
MMQYNYRLDQRTIKQRNVAIKTPGGVLDS